VPVSAPSPKMALKKKKKEDPSKAAPMPSTPEGHVSAIAFLFLFYDGPYPSSPRACTWLLATECWLDGPFECSIDALFPCCSLSKPQWLW
jgi:hypothetical protein